MPRREFLGWDRPGLELAADWLTGTHGVAMGDLVVALPGGRAGRRLLELLVDRADPAAGVFVPPEIVTVGRLMDRMVRTDVFFAGRLVRTLTWAHALSEQSASALKNLMADPPAPDDLPAWLALSEDVRSLHGDLAGEGLDFEFVRERVMAMKIVGEVGRWKTLAAVQQGYRTQLAALDLADPHEARHAALEAGALDRVPHVVLIGAAELSSLQHKLLEALGDRATALVIAPEAEAAGFDDHGCVRTVEWKDRELPLELEQWWVEDEPRDQAARAARILAGWGDEFAGEQISLGVPDASVTPFLERRLGEDGVGSRVAAGRELSTTGPWRLLDAVAELLDGGRYAALAALVRHPDLLAALPAELDDKGRTPAECVDAYAQRHLPDRVPKRGDVRSAETGPMRALQDALDGLLGDLSSRDRCPLPEWVDPIVALLDAVYGSRGLDPDAHDDDRVLRAALVALRKALDEVAGLDGEQGAAFRLAAPVALRLLLRSVAAEAVPPEPANPASEHQPIELLGWVELALDDAPALLITGFNEGHVPESVRSDAFLPDRLRGELGLPDKDQRQARDAYSLALILSSERRVALVSGRRRVEGDPLRPSRLAFHCPDEQIVDRVKRVLSNESDAGAPLSRDEATPPPWEPAILAVPERDIISVSQINRYLASPLESYLLDAQKLRTVDDGLQELDPLAFGTLAHDVLEDFGKSDQRHSADASKVEALLDDVLAERVRALYGARPLAAVALQVEQLRRRLHDFAAWQTAEVAAGWLIEHIEWEPEGGGTVPFDVDGKAVGLRGRIDRIDLHEDGRRWRVLDYKTSEQARKPRSVHGPRKDGEWKNLQLPLYALLVAPLVEPLANKGFEQAPTLAYVVLPRDLGATEILEADWTDAEQESAVERARKVVRGIRSAEYASVGNFRSEEPILAALAGRGLLGASSDDAEEDAS